MTELKGRARMVQRWIAARASLKRGRRLCALLAASGLVARGSGPARASESPRDARVVDVDPYPLDGQILLVADAPAELVERLRAELGTAGLVLVQVDPIPHADEVPLAGHTAPVLELSRGRSALVVGIVLVRERQAVRVQIADPKGGVQERWVALTGESALGRNALIALQVLELLRATVGEARFDELLRKVAPAAPRAAEQRAPADRPWAEVALPRAPRWRGGAGVGSIKGAWAVPAMAEALLHFEGRWDRWLLATRGMLPFSAVDVSNDVARASLRLYGIGGEVGVSSPPLPWHVDASARVGASLFAMSVRGGDAPKIVGLEQWYWALAPSLRAELGRQFGEHLGLSIGASVGTTLPSLRLQLLARDVSVWGQAWAMAGLDLYAQF